MENKFTFLITYYANPEQLDACIRSIRKFYPEHPIIVAQDQRDIPLFGDYQRITQDMGGKSWAGACGTLMEACKTDIGVFMEHDCLLLRPIDFLIKQIGTFDVVGVEDNTPWGSFRASPGFLAQSFLIFNVKEFKEKYGLEGVYADPNGLEKAKNKESGYGISQKLKKKYILPMSPSGYGCGTFYGDYLHHFWFGSYRSRQVEDDGINRLWIEEEDKRTLKDFETGGLFNCTK